MLYLPLFCQGYVTAAMQLKLQIDFLHCSIDKKNTSLKANVCVDCDGFSISRRFLVSANIHVHCSRSKVGNTLKNLKMLLYYENG